MYKLDDILCDLNPPQRQAVTTTEGPVLVIAGAGSGKTRVLTARVAYLIANGIPPERIVAMTFTNKAAGELRERIATLCDHWSARRVWAGTFHSIFARLLRRNAEHLGYSPNFSIYDDDDTLSLIRHVMRQHNIPTKEISPQTVAATISRAKNEMVYSDEFTRQAETPRQRTIATIYQHYQRALRAANAMDFDDLLLNMIDLLASSEELLRVHQELFHYIHVDEYQDTNRAQYEVLKLLAGQYRNLFVVGDDAQSIYSWRGARIENIFEFQRDFSGHVLVRLEQNYRSTQIILSAANAVIARNGQQIPKQLWTEHRGGEPITIIGYWDERDQARGIVDRIAQLRDQAHVQQWSDIAVLYRINAQSQPLEEAFRIARIPYRIIGGISFYKRKEIKDALAYVRLLLNQADDEAFLRIVNEPPRGIGEATLEHLRRWAQQQNIPLLVAARSAEQYSAIAKSKAAILANLAMTIGHYTMLQGVLPLGELIHQYLEQVGLLLYYKNQQTEEALDRYENIARLIGDIGQYTEQTASDGIEPSLADYLQRVSLLTNADETSTDDAVQLMTLHAVKGLEFPVVFIVGTVEGLLPLLRASTTPVDIQEERRLFYVGITRAKRTLLISYMRNRDYFGIPESALPSSFLADIPLELVETESAAELDAVKLRHCNSQEKTERNGTLTRFRKGMRVYHTTFGEGVIERVEGRGADLRLAVRFHQTGLKQLVARFAPLTVL